MPLFVIVVGFLSLCLCWNRECLFPCLDCTYKRSKFCRYIFSVRLPDRIWFERVEVNFLFLWSAHSQGMTDPYLNFVCTWRTKIICHLDLIRHVAEMFQSHSSWLDHLICHFSCTRSTSEVTCNGTCAWARCLDDVGLFDIDTSRCMLEGIALYVVLDALPGNWYSSSNGHHFQSPTSTNSKLDDQITYLIYLTLRWLTFTNHQSNEGGKFGLGVSLRYG
jgi:hypothetical protein